MDKRYSILPIEHKDLWDRYKAAEAQIWNAQQIDLSKDRFNALSLREQEVLKQILAFFVVSDGIVNENLATNILPLLDIAEAEFFINLQVFVEQVHVEFYGLSIDKYITDPTEKEKLFTPIENMETVRKKAEWALKWINTDATLAHHMFTFALVENIFFAGLFGLVFYFRDKEVLPGLCQGNEEILKEENSHFEFANHYYMNHLKDKLSKDEMLKITMEGYAIEKTFVEEVLGEGLPGLTAEVMVQYIQFVTDQFLASFGLPKQFNVIQPLAYMDKILMETRSNFFESKSGTYSKIERSIEKFDEDF